LEPPSGCNYTSTRTLIQIKSLAHAFALGKKGFGCTDRDDSRLWKEIVGAIYPKDLAAALAVVMPLW
jgi:hypothetical protein